MNSELHNYLTILEVLRGELKRDNPNPTVVFPCHEYLVKHPVPLKPERPTNVIHPNVSRWGRA